MYLDIFQYIDTCESRQIHITYFWIKGVVVTYKKVKMYLPFLPIIAV
jgi:hypothetical protein